MRAREFLKLLENIDHLSDLKMVIAAKIKELPPTPENQKLLSEIEDLLSTVGAGGKLGLINNKLSQINDPDVKRAQKLLAKYIVSIPMTKEQREDLFSRWENDSLIDRKKLLGPGKKLITDVVSGYETNPVIKELTDDLSQVATLGQGKGEFLLSVFSKNISKLQKGDLQIDGMQVEIKTLDKGGGRLFDQEVRPSSKFSSTVENFRNTWAAEIAAAFAKVPATGLKLVDLITLANYIDDSKITQYQTDVEAVLSNIFPGIDVGPIVDNMQEENIGRAKQAYALANIEYYRKVKKEDDGFLFIDLTSSPVSMVFFREPADLAAGGLRLHADTVYPITNDPRNAYPQMRIIATKGSANLDSSETPTPKATKPSPIKQPKVNKSIKPPVQQQPQPTTPQPTTLQPQINQPQITQPEPL